MKEALDQVGIQFFRRYRESDSAVAFSLMNRLTTPSLAGNMQKRKPAKFQICELFYKGE
jgi:hypothetical protein